MSRSGGRRRRRLAAQEDAHSGWHEEPEAGNRDQNSPEDREPQQRPAEETRQWFPGAPRLDPIRQRAEQDELQAGGDEPDRLRPALDRRHRVPQPCAEDFDDGEDVRSEAEQGVENPHTEQPAADPAPGFGHRLSTYAVCGTGVLERSSGVVFLIITPEVNSMPAFA